MTDATERKMPKRIVQGEKPPKCLVTKCARPQGTIYTYYTGFCRHHQPRMGVGR